MFSGKHSRQQRSVGSLKRTKMDENADIVPEHLTGISTEKNNLRLTGYLDRNYVLWELPNSLKPALIGKLLS